MNLSRHCVTSGDFSNIDYSHFSQVCVLDNPGNFNPSTITACYVGVSVATIQTGTVNVKQLLSNVEQLIINVRDVTRLSYSLSHRE